MCNCASGKKWKRSVAWFPSYRVKCVADAERNFSRKCNVILMSPYTIVSRKFTHVLVKKQLESRQRQLGKTVAVKAEAYIVSMDRKATVHGLEVGKITFFKNVYKLSIATRSRISQACL